MLVKKAIDTLKRTRPSRVSLSRYFTAGTTYFYGYPSGDASGFLNNVPPLTEELVSARPLACVGDNIKVVVFANPAKYITNPEHLKNIIMIPEHIDYNLFGEERNKHIKKSLKDQIKPGTLLMAQPFMDESLEHLFQISPKLTQWLNDKKNLPSIIPINLLPKRFASFHSGKSFSSSKQKATLPCVVKVSSSSAGDGVYICRDIKSYDAVKQKLSNIKSNVIVEEMIEEIKNYGIQFGIPEDPNQKIEIIGINEQITSSNGEFLGGIINKRTSYAETNKVTDQMINQILPHVRELGWYGVGCFDVLFDGNSFYIIDCNFRMTGMTAYHMLVANRTIKKSLISFSGEVKASVGDVTSRLKSLDSKFSGPLVHILTITENDGVSRFNAAIMSDNLDSIAEQAQKIIDLGIASQLLEQLCV